MLPELFLIIISEDYSEKSLHSFPKTCSLPRKKLNNESDVQEVL